MLTSKQIEIFYEVYKNNSMSITADRLDISQPSVSKTLSVIEKNLGFQLFLRKGKKLVPTHEADELYEQALEIIRSEGKASTSFLQRKLQIGYNRAARIIDMMEANGVVSKANHVGKRDVL